MTTDNGLEQSGLLKQYCSYFCQPAKQLCESELVSDRPYPNPSPSQEALN